VKSTETPLTPGYAYHNSVLFLPWHRVYLAAYEQIIQELAREIARQYPQGSRTRYESAAESLRVPYWDWASSPILPSILSQRTILINTPNGVRSLANPLANYVFHPIPSGNEFPQDFPLSRAPRTQRTPDTNGNDQVAAINAAMHANGETLTDKVYYLVARQVDYAPFSNTGFPAEKRNGSFDSLESIHNQLHGLVGGNGHMAYVPFSTFDPLFWLHHCNIDRIYAIWTAINPNSYVVPQLNDIGTYAQAARTVEDERTPLLPFRIDDSGNFHTSISARSTKSFGYSYPEIIDWGVSEDQLARNVRRAFKKLYNPTGVLDNQKRSLLGMLTRRGDNGTEKQDWFVNVKVNRTLDYPIAINFFLGAPPLATVDWPTAANLVTSQIILPEVTFAKVAPPALAQIPLTRSLTYAKDQGLLTSTDAQGVQAFLASQLQWTVTTATGQVIEPRELTALQISIVSQKVHGTSAADEFSSFEAPRNSTALSWSSGR
jgi:tyrosinase